MAARVRAPTVPAASLEQIRTGAVEHRLERRIEQIAAELHDGEPHRVVRGVLALPQPPHDQRDAGDQ